MANKIFPHGNLLPAGAFERILRWLVLRMKWTLKRTVFLWHVSVALWVPTIRQACRKEFTNHSRKSYRVLFTNRSSKPHGFHTLKLKAPDNPVRRSRRKNRHFKIQSMGKAVVARIERPISTVDGVLASHNFASPSKMMNFGADPDGKAPRNCWTIHNHLVLKFRIYCQFTTKVVLTSEPVVAGTTRFPC
jgi:hypothetical protein